MDRAKPDFLFGDLDIPDVVDLDDVDERGALVREAFGLDDDDVAVRQAAYEVVATQIVRDDPPETWATAQRLVAGGLDRVATMRNLVMALLDHLVRLVDTGDRLDTAAYVADLDRLPLPSAEDVEAGLLDTVTARQGIAADELDAQAAAHFELDADDRLFDRILDGVMQDLVEDDALAYLPDDRVVAPRSLFEGIVLTHRLSDEEQGVHLLTVAFDLAAFAHHEGPLRTDAGDELEPLSLEPGHLAWMGPHGWLDRYPTGAVLAARLDGDRVTIEVLAEDPPDDPDLVRRVRAAYDAAHEEPGLPVRARELLLALVVEEPDAFARPRPPLAELCALAGLERQLDEVAHASEVWEHERWMARWFATTRRVHDDDRIAAARAFDLLEDADAAVDELRDLLRDLADPELLGPVAEFLFPDEADDLDTAAAFTERLLAAARRPQEVAVARWLCAVAAERRADPLAAEAHLELAVEADATWGPALDRLACCRADRGDAAGAARLWRRAGADASDQDLANVEAFAQPAGPKLGRNDACWCGSGRKYKACHLGQPPVVALPDRVGWLCRKAVAFLDRRGAGASDDVMAMALARAAGEDTDDVVAALDDPLVIDVVLNELGWFERFLEERGALLPDDELLLARAWTLVERTVYEVVEVDPGVGLVVRDLRTGDRLDVRERTFSRDAHPHQLVCARAVPDGETNQFVGGLVPIRPGREKEVLDLLDRGDPEELLEYAEWVSRPPELVTREGEPLLSCRAVVAVPDATAARRFLDRTYRGDETDTWRELQELAGDEVVRATLRLDGTRLVVEAMSERRIERVIDAVLDALPGARVVSDERRPLDLTAGDDIDLREPAPVADPAVRRVLEEHRERFEERWCDEPVPALAGLTPRQATADPTRREEVVRLLASFDDLEAPDREGGFGMRPSRLRRLLDLDDA